MALTQQELATLFGQKQDSPILRRIFDTLDTGKVFTLNIQKINEIYQMLTFGRRVRPDFLQLEPSWPDIN